MSAASNTGTHKPRDTEDIVRELRETFAFFDKDRDGHVTAAQFCDITRALGYAPTETEISALQRTVERIYGGRLNFNNYVKVLSTIVQPKMKKPSECKDVMLKSFEDFEAICRGSREGTISAKDFATIMLRHGDPLDADSYAQLLHFCGLGDLTTADSVDYKSLVDTLVAAATAADA